LSLSPNSILIIADALRARESSFQREPVKKPLTITKS